MSTSWTLPCDRNFPNVQRLNRGCSVGADVYLQLRTHGYAHSLEPGWSDIPQRGHRSEPRSSYEGLSRQAFLTPTDSSSIAITYGAVSPSALTSIGIVHHLHGDGKSDPDEQGTMDRGLQLIRWTHYVRSDP